MTKVYILGVDIDLVRVEDVLDTIQRVIFTDRRAIITHVNIMGLNIAYEQEWFRQFLNCAELVYCDGMGVKLGARLLGHDLPQRMTLPDWIPQLAERAATSGFSFFFLGNPVGVAQKAADRLREQYPDLKIGTQHGFFDRTPGSAENEAVLRQINTARPDILLVGFGMPAQEKWLMENWERLDVHIAITCGAFFEYLAGDLRRGPRWMTDHYLEWLARLVISPSRYWKRYLHDNPVFLYRVLRQRFVSKNEKRYLFW